MNKTTKSKLDASSKDSNKVIDVLNLKVKDKEKTEDWYIEIMEHYVPSHSQTIEQYDEMLAVYEFMNNDLTRFKEDIDVFCNPSGADLVAEVSEKLYPFNRLYGKSQGLNGELLKRNDDMKVVLHSEEVHEEEDEKYKEALRASLEEKILRKVALMQAKMQGKPQEEIDAMIQEMTTQPDPAELTKAEWKSDWKMFYDHVMKYCKYDQEVKLKQQETFKDTQYVDRCFLYVGWKHGKPFIEVLNPPFVGYHKSPNVRFIQKGDYAWSKESVTLSDIITEYKDKISNEELDTLKSFVHNYRSRVDKRHSLGGEYVQSYPATEAFESSAGGNDYSDKRTGTYQTQGNVRHYSNEVLLWKTHFEFKAFKQIIFLMYEDEYNKIVTELVPHNFEIPKEAVKYEFVNRFGDTSFEYSWEDEFGQAYKAEKLWIPRRYEITRLGDYLYVDYREVPNQPDNVENPYSDFELSYKGGVFNARNAKSLSPIQRAIPSQLQYYYVKHIQNRELAKYQGYIQSVDTDQIPELLGQDAEGNKIKDHVATWMQIRKLMSIDFYSGSQNSMGGLPPSTRSPGSNGYMIGTAMELINLQNLLELIDREMGFMFGYTPQREGGFTRGTNASDNRQAITQSHHTTEPYYFMHSHIWKSAYQDYLKLFRRYCEMTFDLYPEREYLSFTYFFNNQENLFKVTPSMLTHMDLGLYLNNTGQDQRYLDTMFQMSQALSQNAGEGAEIISTLIKAITSGASPEEVDRMISVSTEKQRIRSEQANQQQMELQKQMQQKEIEAREDAQAHEKELLVLKEQMTKDRELAKETIKGLSWAEDKDQDNDGQLDQVEILKAERGQKELDLKIAQHEETKKKNKKELELKEKQLNQKK